MPFKSEKQRKYLWAKDPSVARKWTDKYGPQPVKKKKKKKSFADIAMGMKR
jgi:hypothetical protein